MIGKRNIRIINNLSASERLRAIFAERCSTFPTSVQSNNHVANIKSDWGKGGKVIELNKI